MYYSPVSLKDPVRELATEYCRSVIRMPVLMLLW